MSDLKNKKIGFIGGGRMAEAIFGGIIEAGVVAADAITVADVAQPRLDEIAARYGVSVLSNDANNNAGAQQLAQASDILLLAVKPQFVRPVLDAAGPVTPQNTLVVSIVGGVTLAHLTATFRAPVMRVMPNTPMMVRQGVAGIAPGPTCSAQDIALAQALFDALGKAYIVPESLIDPLTGISGCGPAYCYMFIEALADGGVAAGLPRDMALSLAAQTLAGAAAMSMESGYHPAQLKDQVCSPGGGTIAGVRALEEGGFRGIVMDGVQAGIDRMRELSEKL